VGWYHEHDTARPLIGDGGFFVSPDGVRDDDPDETKRGITMMNMTTTTIQRRFADHLNVSRKQKPVLKRLKACKPSGRGRTLSAARMTCRPFGMSFQEARTRQWTLSTIFPDQR
jgi:hypothetical protein